MAFSLSVLLCTFSFRTFSFLFERSLFHLCVHFHRLTVPSGSSSSSAISTNFLPARYIAFACSILLFRRSGHDHHLSFLAFESDLHPTVFRTQKDTTTAVPLQFVASRDLSAWLFNYYYKCEKCDLCESLLKKYKLSPSC